MTDVVIIGGGPAGMSAAISASKNGSKVTLIERNSQLGGILNQCIHNGFGLKYFREELTGPEYAHRLIQEIKKQKNITVLLNTFVTKVQENSVEIINENGKSTIDCKAIVLAMGCRERTAGNIFLNGTRPSGVLTAGQAQKLVNVHGKMPGKKVVILGSGDIGLIMARRMTQEGARVLGVYEINSQSSGLVRNISQCLNDFNIPLYLNTTVCEVVGKDKITGVWVAKVDKNFKIIEKTKKFIKCDCLILSVGLIPETDLLTGDINPKTNSFYVDDRLQKQKGIFICGNVLHVHDLVDNVTLESFDAGLNASLYAQGKLPDTNKHTIVFSDKISYTTPSFITEGSGNTTIRFRVKDRLENCTFQISCNGNIIKNQKVLAVNSGEMQSITFDKSSVTSDVKLEVLWSQLN